MLTIKIKTFNELTRNELYRLLELRNQVFIVEQKCAYADIDGKDQNAYHVLGFKDGVIIAYTRLFKPGIYFKEASIGRVLVIPEERKYNYGFDIMETSIKAVEDLFDTTTIKISAQKYLKRFYTTLGFEKEGEEYLEDNIPHIAMVKN